MAGISSITACKPPDSPQRRSLCKALLGSGGVLLANAWAGRLLAAPSEVAVPSGQAPRRLALLVGNLDYPQPHELPPVLKNIQDLARALASRGFEVSQALNLDQKSLRRVAGRFARQVHNVPPGSVTLFYYAGHGLQVNSSNLLLGAGSNPAAPSRELVAHSLALEHSLLAELPAQPDSLSITVIDACRTDLRQAFGDNEGMNQLEAPVGSLVCFSTGAGRPAVSPVSGDQNTFYTASLVRLLNELPGHVSFPDLFHMVKQDVEQTMQQHPLAAIRQLAQRPFIADNSRTLFHLDAGLPARVAAGPPELPQAESVAWQAVQSAVWPVDLVRFCQGFLAQFPASSMSGSVRLYLEGAFLAVNVLRNPEVRLFKTSFVLPAQISPEQLALGQDDLRRAARGDKDAAARVARSYKTAQTSANLLRYVGWLQYAGALGNGIARYELALHYRETGQPLLAAQAEAQAKQLGYTPPRSLGHARK